MGHYDLPSDEELDNIADRQEMERATKTEVIKAFALMCGSGLVRAEEVVEDRYIANQKTPRQIIKERSLVTYGSQYKVASFFYDTKVPTLVVESVGAVTLDRDEVDDVITAFDLLIDRQIQSKQEATKRAARGILSQAIQFHNKAFDHASKEETGAQAESSTIEQSPGSTGGYGEGRIAGSSPDDPKIGRGNW